VILPFQGKIGIRMHTVSCNTAAFATCL